MQRNEPFVELDAVARAAARLDTPEDVRAELDQPPSTVQRSPEQVPEDVLAEQDREMRMAEEGLRQRLVEGRPPVEDEPRS
jgi:hypothetical protein